MDENISIGATGYAGAPGKDAFEQKDLTLIRYYLLTINILLIVVIALMVFRMVEEGMI